MRIVPTARVAEHRRPRAVSSIETLRVLRWTYCRGGERLQCELSLTTDVTAYELRVFPVSFAHTPASERFGDAFSALKRQESFERALVRDGWHLDHFEHGCG
jgi:hypothetical protein